MISDLEVYDGGCCDRCAKKKGEECGGHLVTRCQTGLVCSKGYGTVVGKCGMVTVCTFKIIADF